MKIGIIVRTKFNEQYQEIAGSKGRLLIEMAVLKILKNGWPQHKFVTLNAHKLNVKLAKSCDLVWFSFEDFTNMLKEQIHERGEGSKISVEAYNKNVKKITSLPNIYPPASYLKFVHDKCAYIKWLEEVPKLKIADTFCVKTKRPGVRMLSKRMQKWPKTIFKPVLGGEAKGFQIFSPPFKQAAISKYFRDARGANYPEIIVQRYMPKFATKEYPEIRTVWVGRKFQYAIYTTGWGEVLKLSKKIPKEVKVRGLKIVKGLEQEFDFNLLTVRIDFGKTPADGVFVNEIEHGYGTFAEINPKITGNLPKEIATRLMEIALRRKK
ncbi:MAG: hypothetical protein CL512_06550 [Actinobacteria bacterium]|nr:hypothetical protein [Actinomycetota bacterium]|tara:strand:- start:2318 stop:3286 length:969 start_codon:yes stop_codon:yes gene_type:complete